MHFDPDGQVSPWITHQPLCSMLCGLSAALIPLKMEVREFVPFLSILASYCYFPSPLSRYTVLADGCNYHEVRSVLAGFKSCTLGRNDACADASFVSRRRVWSSASTHPSELLCCFARIKYSSGSRHVYSLQWVLCSTGPGCVPLALTVAATGGAKWTRV